MLQSKLFTKTRREAPKDEVSQNAKLLIRAGFIHKELAGVYSYLPLGLRVLNKINKIIREEMNTIGGQEVSLTSLQNPELWKKTDRYDLDVAFNTELKNGGDLQLAWSHEEPMTNMMRDHISSYRDLPIMAYQFQTKFRNEERAKSGIMRGREFLMKDMYSFHSSQADLDVFYERATEAYLNIFRRVGLGDLTYVTFASGGAFSKYSHEFQTLSEAGEDMIYVSKSKKMAVNKEVYTVEVLKELDISKDELVEAKGVEVGNIFKLGTQYSVPLGLEYTDESGDKKPVIMGCYGIGLGRLMGTVVETSADEKGMVWPKEIAPFDIHLLAIGYKDDSVKQAVDSLTKKFEEKGLEVLVDDRDTSAGEKFADADLFGIPTRLVISPKTIEEEVIEMKDRKTGEVKKLSEIDLLTILS